jgi:hypothetical protein
VNAIAIKNWVIAIAALAGLFIVYKIYKWIDEKGAGGAAKDTAAAAAEAVGGLATGTVLGVSRTVGIPDTDQKLCEQDIASGSWFSASVDCPAGTFTKAAFNRVFSTEPLTGTTK